MQVDPITSSLLAGISGAVAKTIAEKVWDEAKKWLDTYFKDHLPEAQEKSKSNAFDFLLELGDRISLIEKSIKDESQAKQNFLNMLSDPDFSAVLHDSIIAAARTDSKEKHGVLARIVSEKLINDKESFISVVGNKAVQLIPYLTITHLKILGMVSLAYYRPNYIANGKNDDKECKNYIKWFSNMLSFLLPLEIKKIDIRYLNENSCLEFYINSDDFHKRRDIQEYFEIPNISCNSKDFLDSKQGEEFSEIWDTIKDYIPTGLGLIIGVSVLDNITGELTDFSHVFN